ncbi:MAG: trimethylamine methyltransferase family protein [Armatimonadetes bacterium]|nr:trimethylamine methyltransferase family protein [Armatimonadota bacterium]MCX7969508.1 trimethylamine methyltransferase family protein [Armatimonadota bacterium]MDW8144249.1 trimethylamine methyltransferase family protein [Armatimonadota bacterium]
MRVWGNWNPLSEREEEMLHSAALRILNEVGVAVENEDVLTKLADFGARVDRTRQRVYFSPDFVEVFLASSERFDWDKAEPYVGGSASIYFGYYLDPETDEFRQWSITDMLRYFKIAHHIGLGYGSAYVFPIDEIPNEALVPFFHYFALKFTGRASASVNNVKWASIVLEMNEAFAEESGIPLQQVLSPVHIHLVSPLRFSAEEAKIFLFFAERGLRIGFGTMSVLGSNAPVTIAGALAQHLAQNIFINIVYRAYFGDKQLNFSSAISPLDMRTLMQSYGRPEKELCNVAMAQMARRYGARFFPHTGHSDAKKPGPEAGFEKALNALPSLIACGRVGISCGLLSVDEVYSPVQLVIDREIIGALDRFVKGFEVNEETLAFEVLREVASEGIFTGTEHTAKHWRCELWTPTVFAREMFSAWKQKGAKTEIELAREICIEALRSEPLPVHISERLERRLLMLIKEGTGVAIEPVEPI